MEMEQQLEISKEDIAKRFDLPERQTKINTILKLQNEAPVYCVCRSSDISTFMICCEKCDEWYHGKCIGMKENEAKYIKIWYCSVCTEKFGLKFVYFPHTKKTPSSKKNDKKHNPSYDQENSNSGGVCCGQCSNCLQNEKCGNIDYSFYEKKQVRFRYQEVDFQSHTVVARQKHLNEQLRSTKKVKKSSHEKKYLRERDSFFCHGLECSKLARRNSKYCSDECGLALAKARILSILPQRIEEREQVPCVADKLDKVKLDNVRLQIKYVIEELKNLDYRGKQIHDLIERTKKMPITETDEEISMDEESKMYCVTCGWEIPMRSAGRHMEICFKKFETQTAVTTNYKSNSDYCNIFCEYYDSASKTYCKRLRYVCPDHYKPEKVAENEVCGCPIVKTMSQSLFHRAEKFCQLPKKKCDQHFNWEVLSVSEIDLERLRQFHKLNQLAEEEAIILKRMSDRSGALGLLLHSTSLADPNHIPYIPT